MLINLDYGTKNPEGPYRQMAMAAESFCVSWCVEAPVHGALSHWEGAGEEARPAKGACEKIGSWEESWDEHRKKHSENRGFL